MLRRTFIAACVLLCLVLVLAALWAAFDWPPPRLILKYGFPPTGGPTGRTMVIEGVEFVELRPGYYRMGSTRSPQRGGFLRRVCDCLGLSMAEGPGDAVALATPLRWVEIERGYWIGRTEITNEQWERFDDLSERSELLSGPDSGPAGGITWLRAKEFCEWMSSRGPLEVRLPSEAEWEFACRAGTATEWCFGEDESLLSEYAWYIDNSHGRSYPVMSRRGNQWGLFDMYGNVQEWCEDSWPGGCAGTPAEGRPWSDADEVTGTPPGTFRVQRGGSSNDSAEFCRSASWIPGNRQAASYSDGFRVVGEVR